MSFRFQCVHFDFVIDLELPSFALAPNLLLLAADLSLLNEQQKKQIAIKQLNENGEWMIYYL